MNSKQETTFVTPSSDKPQLRKVSMELTNRCNFTCKHCFSGRHGGKDDLPMAIVEAVLRDAKAFGFGHIAFTGGEPTLHKQFFDIVRETHGAGYKWGFVSNGFNFMQVYPKLIPYLDGISVITFSLDGASEETHDRLRGKGSFRRLLQSLSVCNALDIPFTLNTVVTAHNRHELQDFVDLTVQMGGRGLRFAHLMHSPLTTTQGFDLSPAERKTVEAEIANLQQTSALRMEMAPGNHTTSLFPCAPLHLMEINIDHQGRFTKCCHLSSHGDHVGQDDVAGDLREVSFAEAFAKLERDNDAMHAFKLAHLRSGTFEDTDYLPCWYCSNYFRKVDWLSQTDAHSWIDARWQREDVAAAIAASTAASTAASVTRGSARVSTKSAKEAAPEAAHKTARDSATLSPS